MASCVSYNDQFVWMANRRFDAMIEFLLTVATESAGTSEERAMVEKLREASRAFFPGYDLHLEREFPTVEERKFWARCFYNLARAIFLRKVGNQETDFWQSSAIADAYVIARFLTQAVREVEQSWYPATDDALRSEEFYGKLSNIRV